MSYVTTSGRLIYMQLDSPKKRCEEKVNRKIISRKNEKFLNMIKAVVSHTQESQCTSMKHD